MKNKKPLTFLCLSSEFKGVDFLRGCKAAGNRVYLVTSKSLQDKAWPREDLDDIFFMEELAHCIWNMDDLILGLAHFMRQVKIDRVIALDDFDVEKAAQVREHFRFPGMGQTTYRYFRDKLAMRIKAKSEGIAVPAFSALFHDADIHEYTQTVSPPWVVKPRGEASAAGIKKVHSADELWEVLNKIGDKRHQFLIEQFKPGDVYHVDALIVHGKIVFCRVSQYLSTPFEVAHGGGIFRSVISEFGGKDDKELQKMNTDVMKAFGMQSSASHTEFIKCNDDGKYYFLETSSRVGGAHLAEMVEHSSGINLWWEWAQIETAVATDTDYKLPKIRKEYAGIIVSLSRFEKPDMGVFDEPEIVWKIDKKHHVGMILKGKDRNRILELLDDYAGRVFKDFHASAPSK